MSDLRSQLTQSRKERKEEMAKISADAEKNKIALGRTIAELKKDIIARDETLGALWKELKQTSQLCRSHYGRIQVQESNIQYLSAVRVSLSIVPFSRSNSTYSAFEILRMV